MSESNKTIYNEARLTDEEIKIINNEKIFVSLFGFSVPSKARKIAVLTKNELSMSFKDIKNLHSGGYVKIDPLSEDVLTISIDRSKFIFYCLELILFIIMYFWPILIFSGLESHEKNAGNLLITFFMAVVGFLIFYYHFKRHIRPFLKLKEYGFNFGDRYILPRL